MKRILIGYVSSGLADGINKHVTNFIKSVKDNDTQIDCLTKCCDEETKKRFKEAGCSEIYTVNHNRRALKQFFETKALIRKNGYDITYFNLSESYDCVGVLAAKSADSPYIAVHSHSSSSGGGKFKATLKSFLNLLCRPFVTFGTKHLACSKQAAEWLFGKRTVKSGDYEMIYNAVDGAEFAQNKEVREKSEKKTDLRMPLL